MFIEFGANSWMVGKSEVIPKRASGKSGTRLRTDGRRLFPQSGRIRVRRAGSGTEIALSPELCAIGVAGLAFLPPLETSDVRDGCGTATRGSWTRRESVD